MDASPNHDRHDQLDVIVAGAGLAGLAAAATAARDGARVLVVDGHPAGGRGRTDERRGFRFNVGAHALYRGGHAERVLTDLGIPVPSGGKPSMAQWGRAGDVVSPLPFTPGRAVRSRLVTATGKSQLGRFVLRIRSMDTAPLADRSAEAWLAGLGLRDDATEILRTLARVASYADDLDAISADAVASQIQLAVRHGVQYLDGGFAVLVDALAAATVAAGGEVRIGAAVAAVEPGSDELEVRLDDGSRLRSRAVVLAVGGPAATAALLREPPRWGLIGPPATAACLDLGLRTAPSKAVYFGVGEPLYLSTHTPPAKLAPAGNAVVHVMRYGARDADTDRTALWAHAAEAGIGEDDVIESRFLARMVVTHAVPVPGSGLAGRPGIEAAAVPGVYVAGDWVGPDGLLTDGAMASGQAAGRAAARHRVAAGVPA